MAELFLNDEKQSDWISCRTLTQSYLANISFNNKIFSISKDYVNIALPQET